MPKRSVRIEPIDMSLRLWSDTVSLRDVLTGIDADAAHLHVKGEPMAQTGYLAGRIAKRHYASSAAAEAQDCRDLCDWLRQTTAMIGARTELVNLLQAGEVEAVFWVAILGATPLPTPTIDNEVINTIRSLPARILIENYTQDDADLPVKSCL